jgi:hypothetical protein
MVSSVEVVGVGWRSSHTAPTTLRRHAIILWHLAAGVSAIVAVVHWFRSRDHRGFSMDKT